MSDQGFDDNNLDFGEGEAEECVVEGYRETTSSSPSSKRIKEMPIDRLSELPDLLVIHILSFLGVKGAGVTTVLSKRWNDLWAELPRLEFWPNDGTKKTHEFVSWVNRTLAIRKGDYLEKFLVEFNNYNKSFASDVDAWVGYCVKNEANELSLMFLYSRDYYRLPQMMYSCSSLMNLHLCGCLMTSEGAVAWKSLTRLSLYDVELNQRLIVEILSSCPVLKNMDLEACRGFSRLEANSRCLDNLTVKLFEDDLEISAPYVCCLDIDVCPGMWQLTDISSVVDAKIELSDPYRGLLSESELMSNAKEFLEKFKQKLYIGCQCFEFLSIMAMNGWQLPQFKLQQLTLVSRSNYKHSISGIIAMLDSSPNIEKLHLDGFKILYFGGFGAAGNIFNLDLATKADLDDDLLHLKKIRVDNFANPNGEPLLMLARILLKRAPALEEMIIVIDVEDHGDFVNIDQTLLTYPRSSPKAEIFLKKAP